MPSGRGGAGARGELVVGLKRPGLEDGVLPAVFGIVDIVDRSIVEVLSQ